MALYQLGFPLRFALLRYEHKTFHDYFTVGWKKEKNRVVVGPLFIDLPKHSDVAQPINAIRNN